VERKNRSLEEIAKTLVNETKLPKYFGADAVSTICYTLNMVLIRPILKKNPFGKTKYISLKGLWL